MSKTYVCASCKKEDLEFINDGKDCNRMIFDLSGGRVYHDQYYKLCFSCTKRILETIENGVKLPRKEIK